MPSTRTSTSCRLTSQVTGWSNRRPSLPDQIRGAPELLFGLARPAAVRIQPRDLLPQSSPLALDFVELPVQGHVIDPTAAKQPDDQVAFLLLAGKGQSQGGELLLRRGRP